MRKSTTQKESRFKQQYQQQLYQYRFKSSNKTMILSFTEMEFLLIGLGLAGHSERTINRSKYSTNLSRFEAKYYASPSTCCEIFIDLQLTDIEEAKVTKPKPKHLLLALNYLKEYPLERNLAGTFGCTEKTASKWAHYYIGKIQALKPMKIKFLFDKPELYDEKFIMTVDGIHCQICEPRPLETQQKRCSTEQNGSFSRF